jgi:hypothetical protein
MCAFSLETAHLDFFDYGTEKLIESISLECIDSLSKDRSSWGIRAYGLDSVYVLIPHQNILCMINREGKNVNMWRIKGKLSSGSEDYAIVHLERSPIIIRDNKLTATCALTSVTVSNKANRLEYFNTPAEISFDLNPGAKKIENKTGYWPLSYRTGNNYRDYYPQHTYNDKGQLINGFAADDSIFVYDKGVRIKGYNVRSKYMNHPKPFPDDSLGNYYYVDRYFVEESRYMSLNYDPYRKLYYRIVHHSAEYIRADSITLNTTSDKVWSLLILDEAFNVLSEQVFAPKKYVPKILIHPEGILVLHRKDPITSPKSIFTLFLPERQ